MEPENVLPWMIFELNEQLYAINTKMVTGISKFPPVTPIANAPEIFYGVANVRGDVIPIMDLKKMLKIKDNRTAVESAFTALNYKLGGIEDYLTEMRRCVKNEENFSVSSEYFGDNIDLDSFPHNSQTYEMLRKIKEEQGRLEEYGSLINTHGNLLEEAESCGKELINLINSAVQHISDQSKKMVINLSFDPASTKPCIGFVVDSVRAVDSLTLIDREGNGKFLLANSQILSVAHNDKIKGEILVINDKEVIQSVEVYREYQRKEAEKKRRIQQQKEKDELKSQENTESDNDQ